MNQQDQRKADAYRNQQLIEQEMMFVNHKQFGSNQQGQEKRFCDTKPNQQQIPKLFCACNGLTCAGICREQHLYRKRIANPKATAKGAIGVKSWTDPPNQCSEAYTK